MVVAIASENQKIMTCVYHFANTTYGRPFLDYYFTRSKDWPKTIALTVVFSLNKKRGSTVKQRLSYYKSLFLAYWGYRRAFGHYPFKIVIAADVNDPRFVEKIPDQSIGICTGFNQIFSQNLIDRFADFVNVHPSVLPWYRGPVPSYWCLQNGEHQTGYSLHQISTIIDQGELLYQEVVPIAKSDTVASLDQKIAMAAREVLIKWLEHKVQAKSFTLRRIDPQQVYRCRVNYRSFPAKN